MLAQGAAAQAEAALRSMEAILLAADSSLAAVVNVTVYVRDVGLWDEVNRVYERRFGRKAGARHRADRRTALRRVG